MARGKVLMRGPANRAIGNAPQPRAPTPNALRIRRHYARKRNGRKRYRLWLDEVNTEALLVREGLLDPMVDPSDEAVSAALAEFISRLAEITGE